MYQKPPTDEELRAAGLSKADYEGEEPEEVFGSEDMLKSWDVFCAMQTQWRSAGAGAYGLDYNVLPMLFKIYKIDDEELTLNDVRVMEQKALEMMHHNAK